MKYMILVYGSQQDYDALTGKPAPGKPTWTPENFVAMGQFMEKFTSELTAETQEVLAGYWIVDCESFDRATEIAARLAGTPGPEGAADTAYVDIRPIAESRDSLEL